VVRDEATSSSLALDRYDYIRTQLNSSQPGESIIFRDLQSSQLPERPPVPPTMRSNPPAPVALAQPGKRVLQVYTGTDIPAARTLSRQLIAVGYEAWWESVRGPDGQEVVRVRVITDAGQADAVAAQLGARGLQAAPVDP
jgi:hypothetical protein